MCICVDLVLEGPPSLADSPHPLLSGMHPCNQMPMWAAQLLAGVLCRLLPGPGRKRRDAHVCIQGVCAHAIIDVCATSHSTGSTTCPGAHWQPPTPSWPWLSPEFGGGTYSVPAAACQQCPQQQWSHQQGAVPATLITMLRTQLCNCCRLLQVLVHRGE
jgi:hypothetical protein